MSGRGMTIPETLLVELAFPLNYPKTKKAERLTRPAFVNGFR